MRNWFKHKRNHASNFDLVIHCAAIVGGRLNIDGDPLAVATDLSIDAELYNWIVRGKFLPKLIYFSSSAAYPVELQTKTCNCDLAETHLSFSSSRISMPDRLTAGRNYVANILPSSPLRSTDSTLKFIGRSAATAKTRILVTRFPRSSDVSCVARIRSRCGALVISSVI